MFNLTENLARCRQYLREQLSHGSTVSLSRLGLTFEGQRLKPCWCVKEICEKEERKGAFFSLTLTLTHTLWLGKDTSVLPATGQTKEVVPYYHLYCFIFISKSYCGAFPYACYLHQVRDHLEPCENNWQARWYVNQGAAQHLRHKDDLDEDKCEEGKYGIGVRRGVPVTDEFRWAGRKNWGEVVKVTPPQSIHKCCEEGH